MYRLFLEFQAQDYLKIDRLKIVSDRTKAQTRVLKKIMEQMEQKDETNLKK